MSQTTRTFRIFVSSTFSDLKAERNALQKYVFPRLQELCMRYQARFQAIDLRWGVSTEAGLDQRTVQICLDEIARCQRLTPRPNFIILLGDRYGWRPLPARIEKTEFKAILAKVPESDREFLLWNDKQSKDHHGWYRLDENADPAEFILMPREVVVLKDATNDDRKAAQDAEETCWNANEKRLRIILLDAVKQLSWRKDDPRVAKYVTSATEQEIVSGALEPLDAAEHVFGFYRTILTQGGKMLADTVPPDGSAKSFLDEIEIGVEGQIEHKWVQDEAAHDQLITLKEKTLRPLLGAHISDYEATWTGYGISLDHIGKLPHPPDPSGLADPFDSDHPLDDCIKLLEQTDLRHTLCNDVWRSLAGMIYQQLKQLKAEDTVTAEVDAHERFGKNRRSNFNGRTDILKSIVNYIDRNDPHSLVIWGVSGSGKSALIAKAIEQAQKNGQDVIYRFIGATPDSSNGRALLESLCRQISRHYGTDRSAPTSEYKDLVQEFPKQLALAQPNKPLILFLDALDQLSTTDNVRSLVWLPADLPPNVRLIVSTLPGECLGALESKVPAQNRLEIQLLPIEDGKIILDAWLGDIHRKLQDDQKEYIINKFKNCRLPLYLKLTFEEVKLWRSYDSLPKPGLSEDIPGILRDLFRRLSQESNHGSKLVSHSLSYLAAAKNGLSEEELLDILSLDEEVVQDFQRRSTKSPEVEQLPIVIWSRLYFDLEPYLTERSSDGTSLLAFYHGQMAEAVKNTYMSADHQPNYHQLLAAYFRKKADPGMDASWKNLSPHALVELPYHILYSGGQAKSELRTLLTDILYLNARTSVSDIWQLLDDYSAVDQNAELDPEPYRAFIAKHAQNLARHEGQLVALLHHEGFLQAKAQVDLAQSKGLYADTWLRTEQRGEQLCSRVDAPGKILESVSSWNFRLSYVVGLAATAKVAFHLLRLGVLGIVDVEKACSLDQIIPIREIRPLGLFPAEDGRHLVVAYENGEADVLELEWGSHGLTKQSLKTTFKFQLPQFEAPAISWDDACLIYQKEDGEVTKYNVISGEQICLFVRGDPDLCAELRSAVVLDHDLVLAMSLDTETQLLFLRDGNCRPFCKIENADTISLCACGALGMAAAFSNREIRFFRIAETIDELGRSSIENIPICMACDGEELVIATDSGAFYTWQIGKNGSPVLLQASLTNVVSKLSRRIAFSEEGTLLSISQTNAEVFRISLGNDPGQRKILALFVTSRHSYAVIEREKKELLVELDSGNEVILIEAGTRIMRFCVDGSDNLFYGCSDGTGFVLDCLTGSRRMVKDIPSTIAAVAGDPNGGFWMADRLGEIHRIEADGSIRSAWSLNSNEAQVQELFCTDTILVWRGWLFDESESPEGRPDTLFFFDTDHGKHLRQLGRRLFRKTEGFVEAIAHDHIRGSFLVVLGNSATDLRGINEGSAEDFIARRESHRPIDWLRNYVRAADGKGNSDLYLLCEDGSIICMDSTILKRKAILSPSIPFQMLSTGSGLDDRILLADGKSNIFICRKENRS